MGYTAGHGLYRKGVIFIYIYVYIYIYKYKQMILLSLGMLGVQAKRRRSEISLGFNTARSANQ